MDSNEKNLTIEQLAQNLATFAIDRTDLKELTDLNPMHYSFIYFFTFFNDALINSLNRGCGFWGFDLNSGWN